MKKIIFLLVLLALSGAGGGGYFYYKHLVAADKAKRSQLFADLTQCLVGRPVSTEKEVLQEMTLLEARTAHRPAEMKSADGWPGRCADKSRDLMAAVRDSNFLEQDQKIALLDKTDALGKAIDKQAKEHTDLTGYVVTLVRDAPDLGLTMAAQSTVKGPPQPVILEGDAKLPFVELLPLDGGPDWVFIVTKDADKPNDLSLCERSASGLSCQAFQGSSALTPIGTWESASYVPVQDGDKTVLVHQGALIDTGLLRARRLYVDQKGTAYAITSDLDGDLRLSVKEIGKPNQSVLLSDALRGNDDIPDGASGSADILGANLLVSGTSLFRIPILSGAKLGKPVDVGGGKPVRVSKSCRSGANYVASTFQPAASLIFFDDTHVLGRAPLSTGLIGCGHSGEVWLFDSSMCTPAGCHAPVPAPLRALLPQDTATGLAGSHVVIVWGLHDGHGLMMRVAGDNDLTDVPDTLVLDKTDPQKPPRTAIFGGSNGAFAFAEIDNKVFGAMVTADGKTQALHVDWK